VNKIIHGEVTELGHLVSQSDMEKFKLNSQPSTPLENGIPSFWNIALQKSKYFFLNQKDEMVMKFLKDITMEFKEDKVSFTITFKFEPNDFFNNAEITKTYFLNEYQEVERVESSLINWTSDEKNPMKEMKKKQKKSIFINNFQKERM
jgi:nucleosome assembly protein 1-like 1